MILSLFRVEKREPQIINLNEPIHFVGLSNMTSDKSIGKDIRKLGKRFNNIKSEKAIPYSKDPRVFIAVTKGYDPGTGNMEYLMGDVVTQSSDNILDELNNYQVPAGKYAVFSIKPKASFLWGYTIGKTKQYIYAKWLPESQYESAGTIDDFEYHDERSLLKKPEIDLYVAIKDKD